MTFPGMSLQGSNAVAEGAAVLVGTCDVALESEIEVVADPETLLEHPAKASARRTTMAIRDIALLARVGTKAVGVVRLHRLVAAVDCSKK